MNNLEEAYKLIETVDENTRQEELEKVMKEAFALSHECTEAAIVLSKLSSNFIESERYLLEAYTVSKKDILTLELGNLYYSNGMLKIAKDYFLKVLGKEELAKYRLMSIYAYFEDEIIENFYKTNTNFDDDIDYVRMTFTYLLYKYKTNRLNEVKDLFNEINKRNPYLLKAIKNEIKEQDNVEAFKVLKNNYLLINVVPSSLMYLINYV